MALSPWPGEWGLDAGALLLAVALDLAFREPPAALHPVVWTGKLIGSLRSLVSRDARALTGPQVAMAAIESAAENTTDSYVGPWLAFALFGLPGAVAYRALNTLDSMIGYRGRYEHLGKASARLDDLANLAPARLSALLMLAAGALRRLPARRGWHTAAALAVPTALAVTAVRGLLWRDSLGTIWYYAVEPSRPVHGGLNPSELRALGLRPIRCWTSAPASTRWESRRW